MTTRLQAESEKNLGRSAPSDTPHMLGVRLADWVTQRTEAILARYFSGPVIPRFQAGHIIGCDTYAVLMRLLGVMQAWGVTHLAGVSVTDLTRRLLLRIDGERTQTFASLSLAETLLKWGPFEGNPLLEGLSPEQRADLAKACDTSHIYKEDGTIGEWSVNYWMVLARSEYARQKLGLLKSTAILDAALEQCRKQLLELGEDDFDDSATHVGRYDLYSVGVMSVLQPFWKILPQAQIRARLTRDVRLLETLAMENGAFVAWGRESGILSVTGTIGHALTALREGLSDDPGRMFALAANAAERVMASFQDDLIAAHRGRMTFGYRGPHRLMQMSIDCLCGMAGMADSLRSLPPPPPPKGPIFPPRDDLIRFDQFNAGVWMFRNAHMAFQLPFVSAWLGTDYVPWPHSPGVVREPGGLPDAVRRAGGSGGRHRVRSGRTAGPRDENSRRADADL